MHGAVIHVVCACWRRIVSLKQGASYCCVVRGKARDAQKVACYLRARSDSSLMQVSLPRRCELRTNRQGCLPPEKTSGSKE